MPIIANYVKDTILEVPDFPVPGKNYKDLTPILLNPQLCRAIVEAFVNKARRLKVNAICGVEKRGLLFGPAIALKLDVPYILIRREGKTPGETIACSYQRTNGAATLELRSSDLPKNSRVFIYDDLLVSGRTLTAASELIRRHGSKVVGYAFIARLLEYKGEKNLRSYSKNFYSLASY